MPKLTLDDLKKIRDRVQSQSLLSEEGPYTVKVTVHMGTCGIAAGARKVMETLMNEMEEKSIQDVFLTTSGCAGLCSQEPMATVEIAGSIPIKYVELTPEKTKEIFERHVLGREPVLEYAIAAGSERSM